VYTAAENLYCWRTTASLYTQAVHSNGRRTR
jgi:hypothetical protein